MVLFAVEAGSPQINVRERAGSKVAYGFAAGGLPDYDTTSPALPSRQGRSLRRAWKLCDAAHPVTFARGWNMLLSVHSRSKIMESLRATPTRALAAEARLASRRPQSFRSEVASGQQQPGGLDQIGAHQPVAAFGNAAGAIGLARGRTAAVASGPKPGLARRSKPNRVYPKPTEPEPNRLK